MDETAGRDPRALTARQVEVLILAAEGCSNGEIAQRLGLGIDTVKTHLSRVFVILGAKDRTHAVALALHAGVIPLQPGQVPPVTAPAAGEMFRHVDVGWHAAVTLINGQVWDCRIVAIDSGSIVVALPPFGEQRRLRRLDVVRIERPPRLVRVA